ncbi:transposable element Tcb2 transposase [Trichonephila clavipes]|uniref:Transposable element Tcb2 transposase n=1 Tax=Trichonephila clavipes TaxID=2585209 RepID=A0A8X6VAY9_TRICX|nr:transposable element Tcb2 transposase [Trichonephila clavipes]
MSMQIKRYGTNQSTALRSAKPIQHNECLTQLLDRLLLLQWQKHVAWSDESRFQLNQANGRVRIWRQPHESMDTTRQQGTVRAGGVSVMVWGDCNWRNMGPLICLNTTLTEFSDQSFLHSSICRVDADEMIPPAREILTGNSAKNITHLTLKSQELVELSTDSWLQND